VYSSAEEVHRAFRDAWALEERLKGDTPFLMTDWQAEIDMGYISGMHPTLGELEAYIRPIRRHRQYEEGIHLFHFRNTPETEYQYLYDTIRDAYTTGEVERGFDAFVRSLEKFGLYIDKYHHNHTHPFKVPGNLRERLVPSGLSDEHGDIGYMDRTQRKHPDIKISASISGIIAPEGQPVAIKYFDQGRELITQEQIDFQRKDIESWIGDYSKDIEILNRRIPTTEKIEGPEVELWT